tara:strand:+ start:76 stop:432 length:357 start_codon:yes stop_codon:yes gene_type:complete
MTSDNFPYDIDDDIYNSRLDNDFWNKLNKSTPIKPIKKVARPLPTRPTNFIPVTKSSTPRPQVKIFTLGERRKQLSTKINSSPKPAYEDLREYQKISEDIDRKAIDLTRQMEKDISKF